MDSKRHPLMRLISHLRRHRGTIILASICSVMNKFWDLAPPVLIGMAVDVVALREESFLGNMGWTDPRDQFLILVALTVIIWVLESLFEYFYAVLWRNLAQTAQHELRMSAYSHIQDLEMRWFSEQTTGGLMAIMNDDVNQLERFLRSGCHRSPSGSHYRDSGWWNNVCNSTRGGNISSNPRANNCNRLVRLPKKNW